MTLSTTVNDYTHYILFTAFMIAICNLAVAVIQASGSTHENDKLNGRGRLTIFLLIFSTILLFLQTCQSTMKDELTEVINNQELDRRERAAFAKYDSSTKSIMENQTEGFAKYGLKYDSATQKLEKVILDSSKARTTIISEPSPVVALHADNGLTFQSIKPDTITLRAVFFSENAPAKNVKTSFYIFKYQSSPSKIFFAKKESYSMSNLIVAPDRFSFQDIYISGPFESNQRFYVVFEVNYTNSIGNKEFHDVQFYKIHTDKKGVYYPNDSEMTVLRPFWEKFR